MEILCSLPFVRNWEMLFFVKRQRNLALFNSACVKSLFLYGSCSFFTLKCWKLNLWFLKEILKLCFLYLIPISGLRGHHGLHVRVWGLPAFELQQISAAKQGKTNSRRNRWVSARTLSLRNKLKEDTYFSCSQIKSSFDHVEWIFIFSDYQLCVTLKRLFLSSFVLLTISQLW